MEKFKECYTYENMNQLNEKLNLDLNDKDIRILQHRLYDFNKLINVIFKEIYDNKILLSPDPFLHNLKNKIKTETYIELSKKEIGHLIKKIVESNNKCEKLYKNQSGGSFGWILPSNTVIGKQIDVFSLLLDFMGLVPGVSGGLADIINVITNLVRGRHYDAGISFIGLFPYIGSLAPFIKLGTRYFSREKEEDNIDDEEYIDGIENLDDIDTE